MNDNTQKQEPQQREEQPLLPYVLFDIGGTNTRVGVSFDGQTISASEIFKTPKNFETGVNILVETAKFLLKDQKAAIAAGGVAGPITRDKSGIVNAANLVDWSGKPLKLELSTRLGCEVYLENDAAMCGLGEAMYGAGKNKDIIAYMTISTGVNGVKVINGLLDKSSGAVEIGDQIIDLDGSLRHADLESLIGGAALERRYGKRPQDITDPAVWEDVARFTAIGLNNLIVFWAPSIIILGGAMVKKISLERVKMHLRNTLKLYPELPDIVKGELVDLGGLWGALHYLNTLEK